MEENKRKKGTVYEQKAAEYLQGHGYEILEKNYRCRIGEVDIIARHTGYLVFLEVKYRKNILIGMPIEAVHLKKQKTISKVADYYRMKHGLLDTTSIRFDVVSILDQKIMLIENAFEYQP